MSVASKRGENSASRGGIQHRIDRKYFHFFVPRNPKGAGNCPFPDTGQSVGRAKPAKWQAGLVGAFHSRVKTHHALHLAFYSPQLYAMELLRPAERAVDALRGDADHRRYARLRERVVVRTVVS